MNEQPFHPPTKLWLFLLIPLALLSVSFTGYFAYQLFTMGPPTQSAKLKVIVGIFSIFAAFNLTVGYCYLRWAVSKKNMLFQLLKKNKHLVTYKFGRYFLNEDALRGAQVDPRSFKRLQQRDLREVCEFKLDRGT